MVGVLGPSGTYAAGRLAPLLGVNGVDVAGPGVFSQPTQLLEAGGTTPCFLPDLAGLITVPVGAMARAAHEHGSRGKPGRSSNKEQ